MAVALDLPDIQGDILRGYRSTSGVYLFFEVPDATGGRSFLGELVADVQDAAPWEKPGPATATNMAITYSGLKALGVSDTILGALPSAFSEPMRERAARVLDDKGPSAPENWDDGIGTQRSHILVTVKALSGAGGNDAFEARIDAVLQSARRHRLRVIARQDACWNATRREHFGWADGLGQPGIEGTQSRPGQGVPEDNGTWRDLKAGEFVLGYPDEDGDVISGPSAPLLRNGTFMVYRKLYQDIVRFREQLHADAMQYGATLDEDPPLDPQQLYELMAAKVVGRWRDGEAIELAPRRSSERSRALGDEAIANPSNDFRYLPNDVNGFTCPKGAHIRRCNPRDALGWGGQRSLRHRIIRRGMPYGTYLPFEEGQEDDGEDRGLVFVAFNASFERQFEVIQSQWCDDGNVFGLGNDKDYLLGDRGVTGTGDPPAPDPKGRLSTGRVIIEGEPPHFLDARPPVVVTKACEYLLVPGIRALHDLASGIHVAGPAPS
jgi:Dyp-type peroxidase family